MIEYEQNITSWHNLYRLLGTLKQDLFNLKGDISCVFLYFKYSWCKYLLYQLWDDR